MFEESGFAGGRLKLLLNRVPAKANVSEIEKALGRSCDAVFRNDHMALYEAWSEGQFLSPASPLGKELHALAESIRMRTEGKSEKQEKPVEPAAAGAKRWLSFLKSSSIFRSQEERAQA
jgi:Flp pilus assembly CpaE family ATPase